MNRMSHILLLVLAVSACNGLETTTPGRIGVNVDVDGTKALIDNASIKTEGFTSAVYAEQKWHDNTIADGEPGSLSNENLPGLYFTENASYNTTTHEWSFTSDRMWLNEVPMTFWSWNRTASFSVVPAYTVGSGKLSFGYSVSAPEADNDLVLAYNSETRAFKDDGSIDAANCSGTSTNSTINIHFYHAVSEVNFMICTDTAEGSFDPSLVIKNIGLTNVVSEGTCVFTGSTHSFLWTPGLAAADYSRNFGPQTGTGSTWTDRTIDSKSYRKTGGSFFVIPQTLGTDAKIVITLSDDSTREASVAGQLLEPGKYYTYKLEAHAKSIDFTAKLIDWGDGGTYTLTK